MNWQVGSFNIGNSLTVITICVSPLYYWLLLTGKYIKSYCQGSVGSTNFFGIRRKAVQVYHVLSITSNLTINIYPIVCPIPQLKKQLYQDGNNFKKWKSKTNWSMLPFLYLIMHLFFITHPSPRILRRIQQSKTVNIITTDQTKDSYYTFSIFFVK